MPPPGKCRGHAPLAPPVPPPLPKNARILPNNCPKIFSRILRGHVWGHVPSRAPVYYAYGDGWYCGCVYQTRSGTAGDGGGSNDSSNNNTNDDDDDDDVAWWIIFLIILGVILLIILIILLIIRLCMWLVLYRPTSLILVHLT